MGGWIYVRARLIVQPREFDCPSFMFERENSFRAPIELKETDLTVRAILTNDFITVRTFLAFWFS
jgi:hypothetical protein